MPSAAANAHFQLVSPMVGPLPASFVFATFLERLTLVERRIRRAQE